jgi:hypothetical protein
VESAHFVECLRVLVQLASQVAVFLLKEPALCYQLRASHLQLAVDVAQFLQLDLQHGVDCRCCVRFVEGVDCVSETTGLVTAQAASSHSLTLIDRLVHVGVVCQTVRNHTVICWNLQLCNFTPR